MRTRQLMHLKISFFEGIFNKICLTSVTLVTYYKCFFLFNNPRQLTSKKDTFKESASLCPYCPVYDCELYKTQVLRAKIFFYLFYHCRLKRNFGDDSICLPPKKKNSMLDQPACLETLTCIEF